MLERTNPIREAIDKLDRWVQCNGWGGYDPYDIKGTPVILGLNRSKVLRKIGLPLFAIVRLFPRVSRFFFGVKRAVNAKAIALLAGGYLRLYESFKEKAYRNKSLACLSWLEKNAEKGFSGCCWGYPFDWLSGGGVLFPRGTPSGVVSSIVGHAFLDAYDVFHDKEYLKTAESTCVFIINDLNKSMNNDRICFSYTPLDDYEVLNANAWCASLLARVAFHSNNDLFRKMAIGAVEFTTSNQRKDGAWHYWSDRYADQRKIENESTIDNYHTGFILECLIGCARFIASLNVEENIEKGAEFYMKNLFLEKIIPKMNPDRLFPIDIHSAAQGIITFSTLQKLNPEYRGTAEKIAKWTITNMQDKTGYFYYRFYLHRIDKTPYVRWGQSWMLFALASLIRTMPQ